MGLPETATTMLQAHLFPCHSQIEYLGKFIEQRDEFRDPAVRAVVMSTTRGHAPRKDAQRGRFESFSGPR